MADLSRVTVELEFSSDTPIDQVLATIPYSVVDWWGLTEVDS